MSSSWFFFSSSRSSLISYGKTGNKIADMIPYVIFFVMSIMIRFTDPGSRSGFRDPGSRSGIRSPYSTKDLYPDLYPNLHSTYAYPNTLVVNIAK